MQATQPVEKDRRHLIGDHLRSRVSPEPSERCSAILLGGAQQLDEPLRLKFERLHFALQAIHSSQSQRLAATGTRGSGKLGLAREPSHLPHEPSRRRIEKLRIQTRDRVVIAAFESVDGIA